MTLRVARIGLIAGARTPTDPAQVEAAVTDAHTAMRGLRSLSSFDRAAILDRVASALREDRQNLAAALARESGYLTVRDMLLEVDRSVDVFTLCAALARTGMEETINLDAAARGRGAIGLVKRRPIGPVLAITAFNGPILIAAHKIAPAIVAGCSIVIKPSPRVPDAAVRLAEYVVAAGWPGKALAVLPVSDEQTGALIRDERLPVISFTGGDFGWRIKEMAPLKRVHLELGGVGAVIVAADADLDLAAAECAIGGFVRSGQACISVQRVYVERPVYQTFVELLTHRIGGIVVGDVSNEATQVGPLVDASAASKVETMIADAVSKGAQRICGAARDGNLVPPTLLANATPDMLVMREEIFGPVIAVAPVDTLDAAVSEANAIGGAIHTGVFTSNLDTAFWLADELDAGGVIINGSNAWRVDQMPYGGVGKSGFGREGVRSMVLEYTEPKVIVVRRRA
jgi:acyl-CoA reductase-like NAD-dependent aldehyde dehydrogenase